MPQGVDYAALAAQARASAPPSVDYDALAAQARQGEKATAPSMSERVRQDWESSGKAQFDAGQQAARNPAGVTSFLAALIPGGPLVRVGSQIAAGVASGAMRGGTPMEMATQGATDAATNVLPMAVGAAAQALAKPLMRGALRLSAPIARKFGDVVPTALNERIMPTEAGAQKAEALRNQASQLKDALLNRAGGTIDPNSVATTARAQLQPTLNRQFDAALASTTAAPGIIQDFARKAPMDLNRLDEAKSQWDNAIKNAIVARKFSGATSGLDEQALQALAGTTRNVLETAAPGYKALNRQIMTAEGIRQAAANREAIPATGLADTLLAFSAPTGSHVAARIALSPPVRGAMAIGANEIGKGLLSPAAPPTAEMLRQAIITLLSK